MHLVARHGRGTIVARCTAVIFQDVARVLVVEDNDTLREALALSLSDDFEVHQAATAVAALRLIRQNSYCSVVLDLHLRDISGTSVIDAIRVRSRQYPVIVVTGISRDLRDLDPDIVQLILKKPVDHGLIADILRSLCKGQSHDHRLPPPRVLPSDATQGKQ